MIVGYGPEVAYARDATWMVVAGAYVAALIKARAAASPKEQFACATIALPTAPVMVVSVLACDGAFSSQHPLSPLLLSLVVFSFFLSFYITISIRLHRTMPSHILC